jgi:hypothetical protein
MLEERSRFGTFKELMNEIAYSMDFNYDLTEYRDDEGNIESYNLNKLYILPTEVSYKTDRWDLAPGVFEKVTEFYKLLNS